MHSAQRLAQFSSNLRSCFSQSFEDMVLVAGLSFRARQRFTACAIDRFEGQLILRANLRYRTVEDGGASAPLAEFPRNRRCEFCFG